MTLEITPFKGECLKQLLAVMKHTVTREEHVNFIVDQILVTINLKEKKHLFYFIKRLKKCNVHTISSILSFIAICYAAQLSNFKKSQIYSKLVTFLDKAKDANESRYICQLGARAMQVAQKQANCDEAKCE